jgi:uncharacterized protein (TIGR00369 family)
MLQTCAPRTGLDVLSDVAAFQHPMPPAAALPGWQALELRPGYVRVQYTAREEFCNPQGNIQGGFLTAMLDDAMGPAAYTLLPAADFAPTLEMSVSFLRPARAGKLYAEGWIVHSSKRFMRLEGHLTSSEDGELIATAKATVVINRASEGGNN